MAISIQCSGCRRQYNVDEKLAGKMVKCKGCGAAIAVPAPAGDLPPIPDLSGFDAPAAAAGRKCPSCGAALPEGGKICIACGLNLSSGQRAAAAAAASAPISLADEGVARQRKRYVRKPGNPALEQVDEIMKLVLALLVFGGVIVWIVQIVKSPAGASAGGFGAVALIGALLAGFIAPLTALAINTVVRKVNFVPRSDTYARMVLVILLPLGTSMIFGWPSLMARFGGFITLAWLLAPILLIYYLRGEPVEWMASVVTALVAIGLGCLALTFIVSGITGMTGPLYADALPAGPWVGLATGHSPVYSSTTQAVAAGTTPATDVSPTPAAADHATPAPAPDIASRPTPPTTGQVAVVTPSKIPESATKPTPEPATSAAPTAAYVPRPIESPILSDVVADPGLQGVNDVVFSSPTNTHMLVLKHDDTTMTMDRWRINPLKSDGSLSGPYYANSPSVYSLSPRGDILVTLVLFPRLQLELSYFDAKIPKKVKTLDQLHATPSLTPFLDTTHFGIRADLPTPPRTALQICNATSGDGTRELSLQPVAADANAMAVSPNGRLMAALGADRQIAIYNVEAAQLMKKVPVSNDLAFKLIRMCFSPDSSQLAVYSVVSDVPTIVAFKVPSGEPTTTAVISKKPRSYAGGEVAPPPMPMPAPPSPSRRGPSRPPAEPRIVNKPGGGNDAINHDLLWLQSGKYWLVNGNEFIDTSTGTKAAMLDLDGVEDQYLVGTDSILLVQAAGDDTKNLIFAHINEDQIKAGGRGK
jgi:hypothetical protein